MDVIVVQKLAKLDALRRDGEERVERLRAVDAALLERLEASAARHHEARERVVDDLARLGFGVRSVSRDAFEGPGDAAAIVVAVGGDGTVLDVSHRVEGVPLLGVNSDPDRSRGYFCGTDIDGFAETIRRWRDREAETVTLRRMSIWLDGERVPYPCLNDVLVANNNPAMMSRYVLSAGTRSEVQASSGVWISTPAGSTAGIRSAGGTVLPLDGDMLQYLVREPYVRPPSLRTLGAPRGRADGAFGMEGRSSSTAPTSRCPSGRAQRCRSGRPHACLWRWTLTDESATERSGPSAESAATSARAG